MTEKGPAFLLSCRAADALELGVPVFDPNIETVPPPVIRRTADGHYDEDNAAKYLTYKMVRPCSQHATRNLRRWRENKKGPSYHTGPNGRPVWYTEKDLDEWIEIVSYTNFDDWG